MRALKISTLAGVSFAAMTFLAATAVAQESPLSPMAGNWTGNGTITLSDGNKERIRCRSNYEPDARGSTMKLMLSCASDSYRFDLNGNVIYSNGQISGDWFETSRNAAGKLTGTAKGGVIDARVEGTTFAAFLSINTRSDRQNVAIRAPGSAMQEVAISLNRR